MSRTIDERVVEMRFDNKQFERNVHTSLSTLDKLKEKLNLTGASKGLDEVNKAASKVDMNPLARGVETVGLKFNALHTMADHALRRITDKVMDAGERIVKSLTIDPIKTGFDEYETKINSIQTIMSNTASKGTTMDDVTKVIGELNTYADKTIYNFAEMTRNIGTFTAAGIGLEDSAASIQGIANLAAASGSTSQQASTAMYQLSQAMAAGTVKLMDWNSVVNAGMGGEKFQEALKATAKEHGVAVDDIIKKNGSFRESLSEGWITADILNQTLRKFTVEGAKEYADSMVKAGKYTQEQADALIKEAQAMEDAATKVKTFTQLFDTLKESAQSGWSQTWEILIGDFEEAKEMLTKVSDTIGGLINGMSDARNELLSDWKILGGREDILDAAVNIFESIKAVVVPIKEAFRDIFPRTTPERLKEITEGFKNFTSKLILGEVASENLKRTFRGVFSVVSILLKLAKAIFTLLKPIIGLVVKLAGWILSVTAVIGDLLTNLNTTIGILDLFDRIAKAIIDTIGELWSVLREKFISPSLTFLRNFMVSLKEEVNGVGGSASKMKDAIINAFEKTASALKDSALYQFLETIWKLLLTIGSFAADVLSKTLSALRERMVNADFEGMLEFVKSISVTAIAVYIAKFVKGLKDITKTTKGVMDSLKDVVGNFADILGELKKTLKAFTSEIKSRALMNIAKAILILVAALVILTLIDKDKLMEAIAAMSILFMELMGAFKIFTKIDDMGASIGKSALVMLAMSTSVLILATALAKIADLDMNELITGLIGIGFLLAGVGIAAKYLASSGNDMQIVKGAARMIIFAFAIKILAGVVEDLGALDLPTLLKGLLGVSVLLMGLSAAIHLMSNSIKKSNFGKATIGILGLAVTIKILASVCKSFDSISWSGLIKGLIGTSVLLTGLTIAIKVISEAVKRTNFSKTASAIIAISAALLVLTLACKSLAKLSWNELAKGLVGVTVLLAGLTASIAVMARFIKKASLKTTILPLLSMAAAIAILSGACYMLSKLSWAGLAKGLIGIGASLAILAVGLHAVKGTETGSLALLAASAALAVLAPTLAFMGSLDIKTIAKGLLAMAGAFAILGVAGLLLAPISGVIMALAGAIALVGAGALLFGIGLSAISTGIVLLGGALAIGAASIVKGIQMIIVGIIELIPAIIRALGDAIVAICEVISSSAMSIGQAITDVIIAAVDAIVASASTIVDGALQLITIILESLIKYAPQIVGYLIDLIVIIIDMLIGKLPSIVGKFTEFVGAIVDALLKSFGSIDTSILLEGIMCVTLIAVLVHLVSSITRKIPKALLGLAAMSLVILELAAIFAAFGALAQIPGVEWIITEGASFMKLIGDAMLQSIVAFGLAAALMVVASLVSSLIGPALVGIAGLAVVIAEMAAVFALFGGLAQIPGLQWLVEEGGAFIATVTKVLGQVIGSFVGGIIGGIGIGIVDSLVVMAQGLSTFMEEIQPFLDGASQIDPSILDGMAALAGAVVLLTGADIIRSIGSFLTGGMDYEAFADDLIILGDGLKGFSESVTGVDPVVITNAAKAAKTLADMTNAIPKEGGVAAWFAGENSIAKFADEIIILGHGLKGFSDATAGIVPENIIAAAEAAKALTGMADTIPNEGGMVAWFTGENSLSKFSGDIVLLGHGLREFSNATAGIVPENIIAAAIAAKSLAEMADTIPNEGGVVSWFAGENSLSKFSTEIIQLGHGLKGFSDATVGIVPENIIAAATAAKALADMAATIPNEGGVVAWFAGENSIDKFASNLPTLGTGLKQFSDSVTGIVPENIMAASMAAKHLSDMAATIPNSGGVASWFAGENSIDKFAGNLPTLGKGLKGFSDSVNGIVPENLSAAANAAKSLSEMAATIPNEGGIKAWFSGENSISNFADKLPDLGDGLKGFSDSVAEIKPENVTAAANAAKALAEMTAVIPKEGGIKAWFSGKTSISNFADKLPDLGEGLKGFSDSVEGIVPENVTAAANAAKSLADLLKNKPPKLKDIDTYGDKLKSFAGKLKSYFTTMGEITAESRTSAEDALTSIRKLSEIDSGKINSVAKALKTLTKAIKDMAKNVKTDLSKGGKEAIDAYIKGINDKIPTAEKTCRSLVTNSAKAITDKVSSFQNAGRDLVKGFAAGISENTYRAEAKARAMARAAADAAKRELDEHSPSKVGYEIGDFFGIAFVNAIGDYATKAYDASANMAGSAKNGLNEAISKLRASVDTDIDFQPRIRPVLDLSDVRAGAGSISRMFGSGTSLGVEANLRAIGSSMNRQNGGNDDVISEIKKLRDDIKNVGNITYTINGITYDDGSNIRDAVESIVRAAKIERRI